MAGVPSGQRDHSKSSTGKVGAPRRPDVDVKLHAHACVEVAHNGFSLLTDPWLVGPAFLGSWTQFPPPKAQATDLSPDAILITHEHSDRFHEPTLDQFPRSTPILVPDFPNQRMPRILEQMGFANVRPLAFGQMMPLDDEFSITAYEPAGIWNDAIFLIEVAGLRILNLNHAGINARIAPLVEPVDLVMTQAGAVTRHPGGPTDDMQNLVYHRMVDLYGATHVLPYASHYTPWDPAHRDTTSNTPRPSLATIKEQLSDAATVLTLLPGSSWNAATDHIEYSGTGHEPEQSDAVAFADRTFNADLAAICRQPAHMITSEELSQYFMRLNHVPETAFCDDMTARVVVHGEETENVLFQLGLIVADGRVGVTTGMPARPSVTMHLPLWAVSKVVLEDLSWDELHLGGWGSYETEPNHDCSNFWRMLQSPSFQKRLSMISHEGYQVSHETHVVKLIDRGGPQAERILRRYGVHRSSDLRAATASLAAVASLHGLDDASVDRMVGELRRACA